jgi:hypothetical protein
VKHRDASVTAMGVIDVSSGQRRRYRCMPAVGDPHTFSVALDQSGSVVQRSVSQAPICETHAGSRVVRNGTYGVRTPQPRQRYLCTPLDGSKPHTFTPALPRNHVHHDEGGCAECEELRGVHHGETAVARRHSWPTRIVARALSELADGGSYADVSRRALAAAELAAQRHADLVAQGMSAAEADAVVEAEQAEADGATPAPAASDEDGRDTASLEAAAADRARYRRRRRTRLEVAADKAAEQARQEELDAGKPETEADAAAAKAREKVIADDAAARAAAEQKAAAEGKKLRRKSTSSALSHNVWHIAADWTEAFSPLVYGPVEQRLQTATVVERSRLDALLDAGQPLARPQVLLLDDVPVYGRDRTSGGKSRRDAGFFLLVAGEMHWPASDPAAHPGTVLSGELKLRLVRAMPKSNTAGWRLLLDELDYHPDFVVADAGTGIASALEQHYDPARTTLVPSLWHVGKAVRTGLAETRGALVPVPGGGKEPLPAFREHLRLLGRDQAITDVATWTAWWDELDRICVAHDVPRDKMRTRRRNYEEPFATAISRLVNHPEVPVSTGGLETLVSRKVQPMLALRRTGFGNIERTNRLMDLLIAREHGAFVDLTDVVTLLRQDASPEGGWTVPLRAIADPRPRTGRYSSLRDTLLVTELAEARGLT